MAGTTGEVRRGPARVLWLAAGFTCVGIGGVGIVVPVLPTTGFFILAASCFARSSPRFERWVLGLPGIGPAVSDYRAGLGMPRRAKVIACSMIVAMVALSAWRLGGAVAWAVVVVGAVGVWYVARRVPTREVVLARRVASS